MLKKRIYTAICLAAVLFLVLWSQSSRLFWPFPSGVFLRGVVGKCAAVRKPSSVCDGGGFRNRFYRGAVVVS